ncbi:MAG: hypothetical protein A2156_14345 [Deltaproteobacteria bacterium RBG_16_48_10]|nr:MAG: hypothetical protein A2156_14345 [Deltaproteobacteria bacterium RBG_16_48_10]
MSVILNPALGKMKNLILSTESIIEILRLTPQNDMVTQSPRGEEQHRDIFFLTKTMPTGNNQL